MYNYKLMKHELLLVGYVPFDCLYDLVWWLAGDAVKFMVSAETGVTHMDCLTNCLYNRFHHIQMNSAVNMMICDMMSSYCNKTLKECI